MKKLPNPELPATKRPVVMNAKLRKAISSLQQGKRPHEGVQQRMKAMLRASGQWFWMVQQPRPEGLVDTGAVVVTSEKYRHEFTRRLTKRECFEYLKQVNEQLISQQLKQAQQPTEKEA